MIVCDPEYSSRGVVGMHRVLHSSISTTLRQILDSRRGDQHKQDTVASTLE